MYFCMCMCKTGRHVPKKSYPYRTCFEEKGKDMEVAMPSENAKLNQTVPSRLTQTAPVAPKLPVNLTRRVRLMQGHNETWEGLVLQLSTMLATLVLPKVLADPASSATNTSSKDVYKKTIPQRLQPIELFVTWPFLKALVMDQPLQQVSSLMSIHDWSAISAGIGYRERRLLAIPL